MKTLSNPSRSGSTPPPHPRNCPVAPRSGRYGALLALACWAANAQGAVTFGPAASYAVGTNPYWIALGDINGDGHLDLAVTNSVSTNVSVLLGNGNGAFQAAINTATGPSPQGVVAGDFNGDSKLDLVIAINGGGGVSVLLGNGNGTFQAKTDYLMGSGTFATAVGDFNNDGKLDIAAANQSSDTVSIRLGNGDGTFQAFVAFAVGDDPRSVAVGDFNGDGKLDLVAGNFATGASSVSILLGNGDGSFQPATHLAAGLNPFSVATGDFNHDGKLDLAVASFGANAVTIFVGNGDGSFQAAAAYASGTGPRTVVVSDINGDGHLDVALSNQTAGTASIHLGNGDGTFQTATTITTGNNQRSIAVGDFSNDGRPDLVSGNGNTANISLLLNTTPAPAASLTVLTGASQIALPNAAFSTTLSVVARDLASNPAPGIAVTFTAPSVGASATFPGGGRVVTVTTNASGVATAPTLTSNSSIGSYSVQATVTTLLAGFALSNGQTPAFTSAPLPNATVGSSYNFPITASGFPAATFVVSSGTLPPGLALNGATGAVSGTPSAAGTFNGAVVASNALAPDAGQAFSIVVASGSQVITFGALAGKTYGDAAFPITASASSSLLPTFTVVSGPATLNGSLVSLTGAGTVVLRAAQAGNAHYTAAPVVDQSFNVAKAASAVSLAGLNTIYDGSAKTATGTSTNPAGLAITLTYNGGLTAPVAVGTYAVIGTIDDVNYQGSGSGTLIIAKAPQTIAFGAVAGATFGDTPFAISATSTANLPVTFSVVSGNATLSGNAVTITGAGSVTIRAAQAGNTSYLAASDVNQTFTVGKANQAIAFAALSGTTYSGTPIALSAMSSANLPVTFSVTSGPGTISGNMLIISGSGAVVVRASQGGDVNTNAAPDVEQTLTVGKASQSIAFTPIGGVTYGGGPVTMSATTSSGLPAAFSVMSGPATISAGVITFTGAGIVHVRASQAGNADYNPAANAEQTIAVEKKTLTVTAANASRPYGAVNPNFTVTYDGFVGSDAVPVLDIAPTAFSTANGTTSVGGATISAGGGMDDSYTFIYISGTLSITQASQTLVFPTLSNRTYGEAAFALNATASSGLAPVYTLISGPATISANRVTLTGTGVVTISATQVGNANYSAASRVSQSFAVLAPTILSPSLPIPGPVGPGTSPGSAPGPIPAPSIPPTPAPVAAPLPQPAPAASGPRFYFSTGRDFAVYYFPAEKRGTIIGIIPGTRESFVLSFTPDASGQWVTSTTTFAAGELASASAVNDSAEPMSPDEKAANSRRASLGEAIAPTGQDAVATEAGPAAQRTFRGTVSAEQLTMTIDSLALQLVAGPVPGTGKTADAAGYYLAENVSAGRGDTYVVADGDGNAFVLAVTANRVEAGMGSLSNEGELVAATPRGLTVHGQIDGAATTLRGTVAFPGVAAVDFAGLSSRTPPTDRLTNLSARGTAGSEEGVLVTGFVIRGTEPRAVLIRGIGPALTALGVAGAQPNPRLQLYRGGTLRAENDDWGTTPNLDELMAATSRLGAFALAAGSKDAALFLTLEPGAYTAHVIPQGLSGIALAEIYDGSSRARIGASDKSLVNLSTRGLVEGGDRVLIGGFIVTGNVPKKVLVRAAGPALAMFGVEGALANPTLSLYAGAQIIAQNDDWGTPRPLGAAALEISAAAQASGAFNFTPGSRDAALLLTLNPGAYTAQVSSADATKGIALVEVYEVTK